MRRAIVVLVLLAAAVAGCLSGPTGSTGSGPEPAAPTGPDLTPATAPDYDFSQVVEDPHVHSAAEIHSAGHGFEQVAHRSMQAAAEEGVTPGGWIEPDVAGDVAAIASRGGNRAFTLVDVTDPTDPQVLSHVASAGDTWDVRFSDDGAHLFVGLQGGEGQRRDLPAGLGDAQTRGVLVVDVSDPASPAVESYVPTSSVHNLYSADVGNATLVVVNGGGIYEMVGDRGAHTLEKIGQVPGSHDVHVAEHPTLGVPVLYTGEAGLTLYDISDPSEPDKLGSLPDGSDATAWHEQTPIPHAIDGRAIVVGGDETLDGNPVPYWIIDVTDPSNISAIGSWRLPAETVTRGDYVYSPHNVAYRDGRLALAHNHAGVWLVDVSTGERLREPVTVAAHQPAATTGLGAPTVAWAPNVWGAAWTDDGHLLVPDEDTGLFVLEPQLSFE